MTSEGEYGNLHPRTAIQLDKAEFSAIMLDNQIIKQRRAFMNKQKWMVFDILIDGEPIGFYGYSTRGLEIRKRNYASMLKCGHLRTQPKLQSYLSAVFGSGEDLDEREFYRRFDLRVLKRFPDLASAKSFRYRLWEESGRLNGLTRTGRAVIIETALNTCSNRVYQSLDIDVSQVVRLREQEGLTYKLIADAMQCSITTAYLRYQDHCGTMPQYKLIVDGCRTGFTLHGDSPEIVKLKLKRDVQHEFMDGTLFDYLGDRFGTFDYFQESEFDKRVELQQIKG